jgi:thiaminase/transcriptional activator TenA
MSAVRFTDELKQAAGNQWDRVIHHKFTVELAAGTIDRQVLKKYLIQDHRFLDAFVVLLGSIVTHARSLEDRIPACQFLALVTSQENTYFERCFEKLGCTAEERAVIPDATCTTGFCNLMREVALKGTLAEMLSVITVW